MKKTSKTIVRMLGAFLMCCAFAVNVGCFDGGVTGGLAKMGEASKLQTSTESTIQSTDKIVESTSVKKDSTTKEESTKITTEKPTTVLPKTEAPTEATTTAPPTEPPTPKPTEPPKPKETLSQKNALSSAKSYISIMAFSYDGLIHQLEFEQYPHEDAVYGADNCGADWFAEAAESAKSYMDIMPMSREELIHQLEFEGYTPEQAEYGAQSVGY